MYPSKEATPLKRPLFIAEAGWWGGTVKQYKCIYNVIFVWATKKVLENICPAETFLHIDLCHVTLPFRHFHGHVTYLYHVSIFLRLGQLNN